MREVFWHPKMAVPASYLRHAHGCRKRKDATRSPIVPVLNLLAVDSSPAPSPPYRIRTNSTGPGHSRHGRTPTDWICRPPLLVGCTTGTTPAALVVAPIPTRCHTTSPRPPNPDILSCCTLSRSIAGCRRNAPRASPATAAFGKGNRAASASCFSATADSIGSTPLRHQRSSHAYDVAMCRVGWPRHKLNFSKNQGASGCRVHLAAGDH